MHIGKYIREILDHQERSIRWLGDKAGIHEKTLQYKLREDKLYATELISIAKVLNIDLNNLKEDITMKTWETKVAVIKEVEFDGGLHAFEVYDKDNKYLGTINPADIEQMVNDKKALDNGECPIEDGWEDGKGNSCTLNGWNKA